MTTVLNTLLLIKSIHHYLILFAFTAERINMIEGISKETLLEINPWYYETQQDLLNAILGLCKELDPWLPIADAPKDQYILVYAPPYQDLPELKQVCKWHESAGFCIDELRTPTHYKLL